MPNKITQTKPSWSDVKSSLADFDRAGLLALIHDLYAAGNDNKSFLHARFNLGNDPLRAYKYVIILWINPSNNRSPVSVSKAKKAISDYRKALGKSEGLAELMVFYCEEALKFLAGCSLDDESFYDALVRMFEQALKYVLALPKGQQIAFLVRLDHVRQLGQDVGWGVGDDFDHFWSAAGLAEDNRER